MSESDINKTPSPSKDDPKVPYNVQKRKTTPVSRSGSLRSKGIGLNLAVSPVSISPNQQHNHHQHHQQQQVHHYHHHNQTQNHHPLRSNDPIHGHNREHSSSSTTSYLPQVPESIDSSEATSPNRHSNEDLKYDVPLPPIRDLMNLEVEEQLRLLALKEMCIVEIKDSISSLNNKLSHNEKELHKLREIIQKLLYNELNGQNMGRQRQNSNPRDEAIASTKKNRRRTLSLTSRNQADGSYNEDLLPGSSYDYGPELDVPSQSDRASSIWSNLSKPLNLIQQFDNMLQTEFERSLIPQSSAQQPGSSSQLHPQSHPSKKDYKPRVSEDSNSSSSSIPSPLKSKSNRLDPINLDQFIEEDDTFDENKDNLNRPPKEGNRPHIESNRRQNSGNDGGSGRNRDDMMQAVSSSIWSFVNDVRTNVLNSLNDEDESTNTILQDANIQGPNHGTDTMSNRDNDPHIYNLDNGSSVSVEKKSLIDEEDFNKILNLKKD